MFKIYSYLLIDIATISIPFIYSFHKKLEFYKNWKASLTAISITGVIFITWDILFTRMSIWSFNPDYLTGLNLLYLPVEEWLFFICIPYACLFTYSSLKKIIKTDIIGKYVNYINWILVIILSVTGILNIDKLYTFVTFISTAIFILLHQVYFKSEYLGWFYLMYIIIFLFPFLVVNGILTGSFIESPIVIYNNAENLSIRIFTIPVEDFVYGFLLILMNVTIYEKLMPRKRIPDNL